MGVIVQDNPIRNADILRVRALDDDFFAAHVGEDAFCGIAEVGNNDAFLHWLRRTGFEPKLSFFRKSPAGQREPHYIHHDAMMGDWTAILYLNPEPHPGDGTVFWEHKSGERSGVSGISADSFLYDMDDPSQFTERFRVKAQFNRAVIFPSKWFHSRALFENYGTGDDARLIQVAFGRSA